jgi:membrane protease YdiL (CAAX protease family)
LAVLSATRRWIELVIIFVVSPPLLALVPGRVVLPSLAVAGTLCLLHLLCDGTFDRRQLWNASASRAFLGWTAVRLVLAAAALTVVTLVLAPESLLALPRLRPRFWLAVMLLYPVVSVYLQEVIFRAFFFHRYGALFTSERGLVVASAAAFAHAHLVMRNIPALVLTFLGGLMFAGGYARTRALALPCLEHALLGDFVFTIGLGSFFFDGARSLPGPLRF